MYTKEFLCVYLHLFTQPAEMMGWKPKRIKHVFFADDWIGFLEVIFKNGSSGLSDTSV